MQKKKSKKKRKYIHHSTTIRTTNCLSLQQSIVVHYIPPNVCKDQNGETK